MSSEECRDWAKKYVQKEGTVEIKKSNSKIRDISREIFTEQKERPQQGESWRQLNWRGWNWAQAWRMIFKHFFQSNTTFLELYQKMVYSISNSYCKMKETKELTFGWAHFEKVYQKSLLLLHLPYESLHSESPKKFE